MTSVTSQGLAFDPQGTALPNSARLSRTYDAERLKAELAAFTERSGTQFSAASGRRLLPLRSIGGNLHRTDSGGPSLQGFSDTPWLRYLPYFREVLADLPAPIRSARLWAAAPGAQDDRFHAPKLGPPWGLCRLHIPVVGEAGAVVVFFGEHQQWSSGSLWFTASWREYAIVNSTPTELVHLIIDVCHTYELSALFPQLLQPRLVGAQCLKLRSEAPVPK